MADNPPSDRTYQRLEALERSSTKHSSEITSISTRLDKIDSAYLSIFTTLAAIDSKIVELATKQKIFQTVFLSMFLAGTTALIGLSIKILFGGK
jgi:hypothetical protein